MKAESPETAFADDRDRRPLSDAEVAGLGFRPTRRGWMPRSEEGNAHMVDAVERRRRRLPDDEVGRVTEDVRRLLGWGVIDLDGVTPISDPDRVAAIRYGRAVNRRSHVRHRSRTRKRRCSVGSSTPLVPHAHGVLRHQKHPDRNGRRELRFGWDYAYLSCVRRLCGDRQQQWKRRPQANLGPQRVLPGDMLMVRVPNVFEQRLEGAR